MKVYVVLHGELNEGGGIVSTHKTLKGATKAALAVKPCFKGGWVKYGENEWLNGCDYVAVSTQEVL